MTTKALQPIDALRATLTRQESEFAKTLPRHIRPEHFVRVIMTAIQGNPNLLAADRTSLMFACSKAAEDGLLPDGHEGALIPYKGIVKWSPMVWGIVAKMRAGNDIASITPGIVRLGDEFDFRVTESGPHLLHKPDVFAKKRDGGELGAYCVIVWRAGGSEVEVMSESDIDEVRQASQARSGPWHDWPDEMRKKTVIRRLAKRLRTASGELERLLSRDDDFFIPEKGEKAEAQASALPKPARLAKILEAQNEKPAPEPEAEPEGMEVAQ